MSIPVKHTVGSALLALVIPIGASLRAQAGTVTPAPSAVRVQLVNPNQAQLDTLHALMNTLDQLTPGSPAREVIMRQISGLLPSVFRNSVISPSGGGGRVMLSRIPAAAGWIGLNVEGLSMQMVENNRFMVTYFDHPSITSVDPESPAQHAGINPGDVLIAYNGSDVLGRQFDFSDLLVPDKKISVTVQRAGDRKVFDMTVAKAPARIDIRRRDMGDDQPNDVYFERIISGEDDAPRGPVMAIPRGGFLLPKISNILVTPNGALGAIMSTVSPELAKTLKLETGVLVNDVSEGTPAAKSGLRAGDVIVDVDDQPVTSLRTLQEQILRRRTEPTVTFQVVRDKKSRKITVSW